MSSHSSCFRDNYATQTVAVKKHPRNSLCCAVFPISKMVQHSHCEMLTGEALTFLEAAFKTVNIGELGQEPGGAELCCHVHGP